MAQEAPAPSIFTLNTQPGVRRDGTVLDSRFYNDAQWVRFQRGRPRKIGGYRLMTDLLLGTPRAISVDAGGGINTANVFGTNEITQLAFDVNGNAGGVNVRSPAGFVPSSLYTWQTDTMFNSSGGGGGAILATVTPDAENITSSATGGVYSGDITGSAAFVAVADGGGPIVVSGGCCVLQPFLFVYGSNGLIRNSNPNDFSVATGWSGGAGLANEANVAGSKIVKGLPIRGGGQSPAGLFWALDTLIRVNFIGGADIWRYDPISAAISVLAKNAIVENDGIYYWPGVDRFFAYNGVVQELPNDMSLNFFYDNVSKQHRNKTWAMKVPRFGEIWWFFPRGQTATECNHALIYNVREKTWYDTPLDRSAGAPAQIFSLPIMAGGDSRAMISMPLSGVILGVFSIGQTISGATSLSVGVVRRVESTLLITVEVLSGLFVSGERVSTSSGSADVSTVPAAVTLDSVWLHETGTDRIYKQEISAIRAYFETDRFNWMSGGPAEDSPAGVNYQTRVTRVEPDFVMTGNMTMRVAGTPYAQGAVDVSEEYTFDAGTEFITLREQRRECSLVFESNVVGGTFQMGQVLLSLEPGDERG